MVKKTQTNNLNMFGTSGVAFDTRRVFVVIFAIVLYQITKNWCNEGRAVCFDCIWHNGLKHIIPKCWYENITLNIAGLPRRQFEEVLAKSSANVPSHVPYSAPAKSYSQQNFVSSPSR